VVNHHVRLLFSLHRSAVRSYHVSCLLAAFSGGPTDPFGSGRGGRSKIHIRVQQRNGRKCITTVQGLDDDLDLKRICKAMKKSFNCNGSIDEDEDMGEVIQLQGDQRHNVREWLIDQEVVTKMEADDRIVIHGF
jgi:translation initiation factor 1